MRALAALRVGSYQLTGRADADILDVFLYGLTEFGMVQAERYQGILEHAFQLLADNPRMGRAAAAIGAGVRRHECGAHVILYEEAPDGVLILAVVHGSSVRRLSL